jgi:hypothetical protein
MTIKSRILNGLGYVARLLGNKHFCSWENYKIIKIYLR